MEQKQKVFSGVAKVEDDKGYKKFIVKLMKGVSHAEPELYEVRKLVMLRLGVEVKDQLGRYMELPPELSSLVDRVTSVDVDLELVAKFLNLKWSKDAVVKLFSSILDVYEVAKPGDIIGEMEMDYSTFEEFMLFLKTLCFDAIQDENIF